MAEARTWFGPIVGGGVLSSALAAAASAKAWFSAPLDFKLMPGATAADTSIDMPLALAVSLVVLAGWGAVLVTRGRVRRLIMGITALAALGFVACLVWAPLTLPDDLRAQLQLVDGDLVIHPTGWFIAAAVAGMIAAVTALAGVRLTPRWPAMGSRYDAPGGRAAPVVPETDQELWKALSEGRDPTDRPNP